ncbi:MAG: hypothetical protein OEZ16_07500 [Chromatiales bacterium]|nr:hypothetical protein [Chromatiales bacterium]
MRYLILFIALLSSGCAIFQVDDGSLEHSMAAAIERGDYRQAHDYYSQMSEQARRKKSVRNQSARLHRELESIREKTQKESRNAIAIGDWKKAIDLYRKHEYLIEIDKEFEKNYREFNARHGAASKQLQTQLLVVTAKYLVEATRLQRDNVRVSPYSSTYKWQLWELEREAKGIADELIAGGELAIKENDISTARKLIPLAHQLGKSTKTATLTRKLEDLIKPISNYVDDLMQKANHYYSDERYEEALALWDEILEFDPNNQDIQAQRQRTITVLDSLKRIEHENERRQ